MNQRPDFFVVKTSDGSQRIVVATFHVKEEIPPGT
jgi:hypothetical protein